ncbi:MAG: HupE/UreJ family protein [Chthoniobacterales bacterium]
MERNRFCAWLAALVLASSASAHPMPSSAVLLDFYDDGVAADLRLPLDRLEIAFAQPLTRAPVEVVARYGAELSDYIIRHVNPRTSDGRAWTVQVRTMSVALQEQPIDLVVRLWLQPPAGAPARKFTFDYDVIAHEIVTHSVLVSVRSDWNNGVFSNQPELLGTIRYVKKSVEIDRAAGSWWRGFRSVLGLGMHHIAEGTDHLLFLLVLLLPAPLIAANGRWGAFGGVRHGVLQLVKVVTAFTVGHSITLIAGTLGWLRLSSQPVETLIALSIFVSAIHALRPWFAGREPVIAAAFGLVHGLAFATVLAEFGLGPWRMALCILGFNLGIELMQLAIVAVTVPWLVLLSRTPVYTPVRVAGACFGAAAAIGWMAERALNWPNPVGLMVDAVAHRAVWVAAMLACLSLLVTAWQHAWRISATPAPRPSGSPNVSNAIPGRTAPLNQRSASSVAFGTALK